MADDLRTDVADTAPDTAPPGSDVDATDPMQPAPPAPATDDPVDGADSAGDATDPMLDPSMDPITEDFGPPGTELSPDEQPIENFDPSMI